MEEALRDLLLTAAPITALIQRRADWGVRAQGSPLPAITLHQISGGVDMHMRGATGWNEDLVQLDCWGADFLAARNLANLIAGPGGLLVGYRGTHQGVQLRTLISGRRSDSDTDSKGPVHRTMIDAIVWHRRVA